MQTPSNSDLRGIDVSRWQGSIDWQAVRGMAVEIAYIKSSEGADYIDPYFERNYSGAQSAGVKCGFYHFMTAISETAARAQAEYFARVISGKRFQARPTADLPYDRRLSAAAFTRVCAAFLERVEELTGVTPMIYSSAYGAREYLLEPLNKYPLWVANYGVGTPESNPRWARWTGFQYSETGRVAGISTLVDMDWFTDEALTYEHELPAPDEPAKSPYNGEVYYVVQRGDTLTRIAARYGATAAQARALERTARREPNLSGSGIAHIRKGRRTGFRGRYYSHSDEGRNARSHSAPLWSACPRNRRGQRHTRPQPHIPRRSTAHTARGVNRTPNACTRSAAPRVRGAAGRYAECAQSALRHGRMRYRLRQRHTAFGQSVCGSGLARDRHAADGKRVCVHRALCGTAGR